jgi:hypothetical protein
MKIQIIAIVGGGFGCRATAVDLVLQGKRCTCLNLQRI